MNSSHGLRAFQCVSKTIATIPLNHTQTFTTTHLKDGEQGLGKVVEGAPLGLGLVKVELAPKHLHAQQGEDDDEEEEQQ